MKPNHMKRLTLIALLGLLCLKVQAQKTDSIVANNYDYQRTADLVKFHNLRYLKLYSFKGDQLPDIFDQLPELEYLEINSSKVKNLPSSIWELSKLQTLIICNGYSDIAIPKEIGRLTQLTKLHIYNHHFSSVPEEIGNLVNLEDLMLSGELKNLPQSVSNWKKLKDAYLNGNQFETIPSPLFKLTQLNDLDLGDNKLSRVNDSIRFLNQLINLSLDGNMELDHLPPHFCELKKLENLFLHNTRIHSLPNCLNEIFSLKRVRLCKTVIDDPIAIDKIFKEKIDWEERCIGLESHLINFREVYGAYKLKLENKKDTVILHYTYSYNHPSIIDEEYTQSITIKILEKDSLLPNHLYTASNPHFIISSNHFSVWDWGSPTEQKILGYLQFSKISEKECKVYLNLDLIENGQKSKLADKFLTFD